MEVGFLEVLAFILLATLIYGQFFLARAKKRFIRLFKEGDRVQAKIIGKQIGISMLSKSIFHYPDVKNGLFIVEYEFTDKKNHVQKNASSISEDVHKNLRVGDEIEICVDKENGADSKVLTSIQRDELACNGIKVVVFIGMIIVIGGYMFLTL